MKMEKDRLTVNSNFQPLPPFCGVVRTGKCTIGASIAFWV